MKKRKNKNADKPMETVNKNLIFLRNQKNFTQEEMADVIGVKRASIGSYEEGRAKPTYKTVQKLSEYFGLSIDRLLTEDLSELADRTVLRAEAGTTDTSVAPKQPDIPREKLKILALTLAPDGKENIELVPEKASAGYLQGYSDPKYLETLPKFRLPFLAPGTYRAFEIKGDSMLPLTPGTIIIGKYVENERDIKSGNTYIILSKNEGIVYKRVFKNPEQTDVLLMRSDNEIYKPYYINVDDIIEIWRAQAYISQDLPDNESTIDRLASQVFNLQAQLNDLKRKVGDA